MSITCLIGASASGKSSIERALNFDGYDRIISYTTRPMRKGEKNGVDYIFLSDSEFDKLKTSGFFAETAQYREWNYGLSLFDIDYKNKEYIAVVTEKGYKQILNKVGKDNVTSIFISTSERTRMQRLLDRGDEIDEIIRRIQNDRIDFEGVEDICDYIVENDGNIFHREQAISQIKSVIEGTIKHL